MATLSKKTILITGANSGIGYETAKLFLAEGSNVIITGRREAAVKEAVLSLGTVVQGLVSDAGKMKDILELPDKVRQLSDGIDTLFVNAGVFKLAPFGDTTEEIFDENVDVNFKGVFFTIQRLLPLIPDGGNIILNASIVAHVGLEGSSVLQEFAAGVQGKVPLKRFGGAAEVARAALFLANSGNSGFITGIELVVDGGKSITF